MAKKGGKDYKFRGRAVEGRGRSLDAALSDLDGYWNSRPSLVMHDYGVIELQIVIGTTTTIVEVADKKVIDAVEGGDTTALVSYLAGKAGVSPAEMSTLLGRADEVIATVDRIRPPSDPNFWTETPGTEASVVLPTVIAAWATEAAQAPITPAEKRKVVGLVALFGQQEGKSLTEISKESGIPRSTLRDALERERMTQQRQIRQRTKGARLESTERAEVMRLFAETENATDVARKLGLSDRTVRGVVQRERGPVRNIRKAGLMDGLYDLAIGKGMSASAAARELGMPERTARSWVRKMKKKED